MRFLIARTVRQEKPGEGGSNELKPSEWDPAGQTLPGKGATQPEPSVAWCEGDLGCEAYTGSTQAAELSSEIFPVVRADAVVCAEGSIDASLGDATTSPESKTGACVHWGSTGTWEVPSPPARIRLGDRSTPSRPPRAALRSRRNKRVGAVLASPSEGNEATRHKWRDVGALRSTDEAGERTPRTLWREG